MFGIGLPEMILILALALIVVGPDKLPELARSVAKGVLELKKTVSSLKENLADENPFESVKPELEEAAKSLKEKLGDPIANEWKGILPDEGVNPLNTDEQNTVVEGELLSEKDKESLAAMDIAQAELSPDSSEPIEKKPTGADGDSEQQPDSEPPRQNSTSLPS
jgi:sec-independent protein translocase protein TatB